MTIGKRYKFWPPCDSEGNGGLIFWESFTAGSFLRSWDFIDATFAETECRCVHNDGWESCNQVVAMTSCCFHVSSVVEWCWIMSSFVARLWQFMIDRRAEGGKCCQMEVWVSHLYQICAHWATSICIMPNAGVRPATDWTITTARHCRTSKHHLVLSTNNDPIL